MKSANQYRRRLSLSARALVVAGGAALAFGTTPALAQDFTDVEPPSNESNYIPVIDYYDDITVWSEEEPNRDAGFRYSLHALIDGREQRLPVPVRNNAPFDVDLGPTKTGEVVAAYSRCTSAPPRRVPLEVSEAALPYPVWTSERRCDIYRFDFTTMTESKVQGASTDQASEMLPSIWRGDIAFARVYERRAGDRGHYPYLYVRPLIQSQTAKSVRQAGGSRGNKGRPGPTRLDLYGKRLNFVWNHTLADSEGRRNPKWISTVRLDTIGGSNQVLDKERSGSRTSRYIGSFVGPQGSNGRIYYGLQRALLEEGSDHRRGSSLRNYQLNGGSTSFADAPQFLIDVSVDRNKTYLGIKPSEFSFYSVGKAGKLLFATDVKYPTVRVADAGR